MSPTLLILAGGIGSRYGSFKQIDKIGPSGERIIDYSVYDAVKAGFKKIVYVIHKDLEEEFKEVILDDLPKEIETDYVCQELDSIPVGVNYSNERKKPWGTGHALLVAGSKIKEPFAVINADDFYGFGSFQLAANFLKNVNSSKSRYALIGYILKNTLSNYGSVSRGICQANDLGYVTSIVERTKIKIDNGIIIFEDENNQWKPLEANEIASMNFFAFTPDIFEYVKALFIQFLKQNSSDSKIEFELPTVINKIIQTKKTILQALTTNENWFGLTYKEDKPIAKQKIATLIEKKFYPIKLWD